MRWYRSGWVLCIRMYHVGSQCSFFHSFVFSFIRSFNHQLTRASFLCTTSYFSLRTILRSNLLFTYSHSFTVPCPSSGRMPSLLLALSPRSHPCALYILQAHPTFLIPTAFSLVLSWSRPSFFHFVTSEIDVFPTHPLVPFLFQFSFPSDLIWSH